MSDELIKQVIILRKDLNMRKGKMAAQSAHASMKIFFDRIACLERHYDDSMHFKGDNPRDYHDMMIHITDDMRKWVEGEFTKVVLSVKDEENLLAIFNLAHSANLPCSLITDAGKTEFDGVPTHRAIAIGPAQASEIDAITGPESELYKSGVLS